MGDSHFAAFRTDIGERVEHMSEFLCWEILRMMISAIYCLWARQYIQPALIEIVLPLGEAHTQFT